jgi:hypothetical protein
MADRVFTILDLIDLDLKEHNSLNLRCIGGRKGLVPLLERSYDKAVHSAYIDCGSGGLPLRFSCRALFDKQIFAVVSASGDSSFYPSALPRFV